MIPYARDPQSNIPTSSVKVIGLGGAGTNMLERFAGDGMDGAELLALNTDQRTLGSSLAKEQIQLGVNLTKGLGTGGDPELGHQAVLEAEALIRAAVVGRRIVFLCVGLGGGTGSGAAPMVTRIAREEGAFVVVFATMPFAFEGKRRRDQAETALNELAVLSNALVTFDNNRMGELVVASQGIHEAFLAADEMICESMKAVIRLVTRPGLINIGLDDLMSALRTKRSRCLFGSGLASGEDRAASVLRNALASPLLDQGALLQETQTVLVHLCGGESLTLFEIESLMQRLQTYIPETAQVLFGAAVDPAMGDSLSLTLISALPEDSLTVGVPADARATSREVAAVLDSPLDESSSPHAAPVIAQTLRSAAEATPAIEPATWFEKSPASGSPADVLDATDGLVLEASPLADAPPAVIAEFTAVTQGPEPVEAAAPDAQAIDEVTAVGVAAHPRKRPSGSTPWSAQAANFPAADEESLAVTPPPESEVPKLKLVIKASTPQSELSLESTPRGRFEGEVPNVFEGEDLDLPPFLRKKK